VITDTFTYYAFGLKASTGTTTNSFTWVGELGYFRDTETGEYELGVRQYLPERGRFKSQDPLGLAPDANPFRYVGNRVVLLADPSGMDSKAESKTDIARLCPKDCSPAAEKVRRGVLRQMIRVMLMMLGVDPTDKLVSRLIDLLKTDPSIDDIMRALEEAGIKIELRILGNPDTTLLGPVRGPHVDPLTRSGKAREQFFDELEELLDLAVEIAQARAVCNADKSVSFCFTADGTMNFIVTDNLPPPPPPEDEGDLVAPPGSPDDIMWRRNQMYDSWAGTGQLISEDCEAALYAFSGFDCPCPQPHRVRQARPAPRGGPRSGRGNSRRSRNPRPRTNRPRLGKNWKPIPVDECTIGCEDAARQIKRMMGGETYTIRPRRGRFLGPFMGHNTDWRFHEVNVKDGVVRDAFTGIAGLRVEEYKALWDYRSDLDFGF
jgi:RHS repeat-associated protein